MINAVISENLNKKKSEYIQLDKKSVDIQNILKARDKWRTVYMGNAAVEKS